MKRTPDNADCDVCGAPATVHLHNSMADTEHLFCTKHKPHLRPGQKDGWSIRRYRVPPGNSCSRSLAAPPDSPEHQMFRIEMCDLQLLGGDGACRYYLSMLTQSDQFALWNNEFVDNLREYILDETEGAAARFRFDASTIGLMAGFLKFAFLNSQSDGTGKLTKEDRAVELLLRNPRWSDEKIARSVPTTIKQLQRFTNYKALKSSRLR